MVIPENNADISLLLSYGNAYTYTKQSALWQTDIRASFTIILRIAEFKKRKMNVFCFNKRRRRRINSKFISDINDSIYIFFTQPPLILIQNVVHQDP